MKAVGSAWAADSQQRINVESYNVYDRAITGNGNGIRVPMLSESRSTNDKITYHDESIVGGKRQPRTTTAFAIPA